jgi:hypothetical protein
MAVTTSLMAVSVCSSVITCRRNVIGAMQHHIYDGGRNSGKNSLRAASILLSAKADARSNRPDHDALRGHLACSPRDFEERTLARYALIWIAMVIALGSACAGSPTAPTPPGAFTGGGFATVPGGYQCNVQWTPTGGKPQDVTGLATWSSSDTSIATVNSTGFVTARSNGSVAIRFSYKGSEGFMTLSVELAR